MDTAEVLSETKDRGAAVTSTKNADEKSTAHERVDSSIPASATEQHCRAKSNDEPERHNEDDGSITDSIDFTEQFREKGEEKAPFSVFSSRQKRFIGLVVALASMFPQLTALGYLPALNSIREEFHASITMANATVSAFVALQAITPMLWGPLSDLWGRRPVYLVSLTIYTGACIGAVFSQSILQILFMRMLMALGSGAAQVLGQGVLSDIVLPSERGSYTALFSIGQMVAPLTGPIVSGVISNQAGWRYIFVLFAALGAIFFIVILCFIPETLRSLVGNGSGYANPTPMQWIQHRHTLCQSRTESTIIPEKNSARSRFTMPDFTQPLRSLGQLDYLLLFTYLGLHFGVFITQMTVASIFLQVDYGLDDLQTGLTFISRDIGAIIGSITHGRILDRQYAHYLRKYQATDEEKKMDPKLARLAADFPIYRARCGHVWIDALLLQTSSIAFAWCLQYNVHIAALLILQCIFTFGHNGMMVTTQALMTDLATGRVATVAAALNFVRCGLGFVFTQAVQPGVDRIGVGWILTIFTFILVVSNVNVPVLLKIGPKWRARRLQVQGTR